MVPTRLTVEAMRQLYATEPRKQQRGMLLGEIRREQRRSEDSPDPIPMQINHNNRKRYLQEAVGQPVTTEHLAKDKEEEPSIANAEEPDGTDCSLKGSDEAEEVPLKTTVGEDGDGWEVL
ncbi:unnamed protein product [Diplocarpon coronariae]|uniref:Uncharacterized protein n=1 Tax=Diplocarpon coronariae TaxID=2795749 RepID=A0A218ZJI2_9HELO|nr:hypothetical protein JHW43_002381 [Diplocarpon mali]OWP07386.1 hypothetical protein B2J93_6165 [Marssonina coronariae]